MTSGLPVWAGSVDTEALAQLLALGRERDWLDCKRQCDLSETRGLVEIVKDMGAMMVTGGYLIVGADDQGQPSGEPEHLDLFDPAKLHAKAAKYISGPNLLRAGCGRFCIIETQHIQGRSVFVKSKRAHPHSSC